MDSSNIIYLLTSQMIKSLFLIILLFFLAHQQTITPYYILPVQTTQNVVTSYSFLFYTDTQIANNAWVAITFPFEFSPNALTQVSRVRYSTNGTLPVLAKWSVKLYKFTIQLNQIAIGNITIVIDNVLNPKDYTTSSYFVVETLFKNVAITSNKQFGRTPFTPPPIATAGATVKNYQNTYIQQGSSWSFNFTLSTSYPANSTLRFVFPQDFFSNKVQCNVSGNVDPNLKTRVFPNQNVYDCLNLQQPLSGNILVILSGIVNPNYQMTSSGFQIHVLQPNNVIVSEIISSVSTVLIQAKPLNTTVTIPNNYRNNSLTYIFQINTDTNLMAGDYLQFSITGLWTLFANMTKIIAGVGSDINYSPTWTAFVNSSSSITYLTFNNFSSILKTSQFTFYLPLVTPVLPNTYTLNINAYRKKGGLAQYYSQTILINQTTGYIREMKLHPMQRAVKLSVGLTGPLEIVLFLQNNLPKTNVLTYGKIVMEITPNIPAPIVALNGVPKCYFYSNIPALNCTFDSTDPAKTVVTIFTPKDFNFQQSEVPLTITTEGFQQPINQGITIDTLVKRYFFQIQFYSHLRPPPIPQQVLFDEWIPDSISLNNSLSCINMLNNYGEYDHLTCNFTTPAQVLNANNHIHFFRVTLTTSTGYLGWRSPSNANIPDYPCLMWGVNVSSVPYVKCDYITWTSGPYESEQYGTRYSYINFYGLQQIPGGSVIYFQLPKIQREWNYEQTSIKFSILEDTPGYNSPIIFLYNQTISFGSNSYGSGGYSYEAPSYSFSNSIINKVTSFTLNSYYIGVTGASHVVLELDQVAFPNIGRGANIVCGSHKCSKFDKPIQYFVLYPTGTLPSTATLTFPAIQTPPYAGDFTFYTRTYSSVATQKKSYFTVTINPDVITTRSFTFSSLETITTLYPNSNHLYTISWTTVNPAQSVGGTSYSQVTINNIFTIASTYCQISTTNVAAYDGRGIMCQLTTGGNQIKIKNLNDVPAGATFALTVELISTAVTATVSPTVTIQTYWGSSNMVDQAVNVPFTPTPLTNTNLTVLSTFSIPSASQSTRSITAGYFGPLLVYFNPRYSSTVVDGKQIILTMPSGFYPSTVNGANGLPLSCIINSIRFPCTYTLSPFTITITNTNSSFLYGNNIINITTEYQIVNGITYPTSQGRYLLRIEIFNTSSVIPSLQKVEQFVDILPGDVAYFNVTWAVRDIGITNIFTLQFKNGPTIIPSYNDATTAGRIYFGFPMVDANNNQVFASNLGFTSIQEGAILPCYFDVGFNFVTASASKTMYCKIRLSNLNSYYTWVEVVNFAAVPAGAILRIILGKVTNPSLKQYDINFLLKVKTYTVASAVQSALYQTNYNMFIDMVSSSITNRNQLNSSSVMFQPGSTIGQTSRYLNITPYTASTFSNNDWFIVDLDPRFPLNGVVYNCQSPFYQYCIVYPTINWLAIKVGNGTIISLQPFISKLPISISRVDTTYHCFTFLQGRWSQTITYTVTAAYRWLQLRGTISGFTISVQGSQNKINVGQKDVQILVTFNVSHIVPIGGTIEIQFPSNTTMVPAIKPHCRSAVTLGSALNGFNTGKPALNVEGEVGCTVQNSNSWIITGFDTLPAGSQVKIFGIIDFPTVVTNSLGMGYVCTYSDQSSNAFLNAKTIDYLSTNFPLSVQNITWKVDAQMAMIQTGPLRVGFVGQFKFLLNMASTFYAYTSGGYMNINLWYQSIYQVNGGFNVPSANLVCTIINPATLYKYGCYLTKYQAAGTYTGLRIQTYQNLPANTNLQVTLTTQKGSATEGITFPTVVGTYKTEIQILYSSGDTAKKNQAQYIEVYGSNFNALYFNSTVTMPADNNFIIVVFTPCTTISNGQQFIIEIPTVSVDGQTLFPADLGMGYASNDDLIFDLFESGISSMKCKVYPGTATYNQPTKIVCSSFSASITTAMTIKFGFWVVNPASSIAMAIPIQVYAYDQTTVTKYCWSIVQAGIRILPITLTPIVDVGNFASSSTYRQIQSTSLSFTTRNTKAMVSGDWYIMKFNFDLRNSANSNGAFVYNSGLGGSGDVIFMRNCRTVLLRVGTTTLNILASGVATINARITSLIYNPSVQLTSAQASIIAYTVYNYGDGCQKIIYSDQFPSLVPNQPTSPTFSFASIYSNSIKGQSDDYRFTFTMSNTAGNSTSLVKLISISFPPFSTYDITIQGKQCFEYSTSTIEVDSCFIDPSNRVIWITPVIKSTYSNDHTLIIESAGLAFSNPITSSSINFNQFVIRYYTWPDGTSNPGIIAGSDNWCFMKQDSSRINSNTISFSNTYYTPHTAISVPNQVYINEWEPADTNIGVGSNLAKSAIEFKMIAPAAFSNQAGTGNYHVISVIFNSYYSTPTLNQTNNDLYYYVPQCSVNGFKAPSCYISGGTIFMMFQNIINNGQQFAIRFTIINPFDLADEGFILINTANPTVTLPVYITPHGGANYYIEPEPFHTFYRTSLVTYPSMGISSVTVASGTQAAGQLNYLQFVITLSRNDINGFVIEIPVLNDDGTKIYNTPALLGLQSGAKYPCSLGIYTPVYCYYEQGSSTKYGKPTRIFVTDFSVPANNSLSFRMLFTNPDIVDVFPSFNFKAFGGSYSAPDLMGKQLKGSYKLIDPFKIYPSNSYASTSSCTCYPTKGLWQTLGNYDCYVSDNSQNASSYVILQWVLVDSTYGTMGEYTNANTHYDQFFMSTGLNQHYVYLVTKLSSYYTANSGSYHRFGQLRMKHHIVSNCVLYLLGQPWTRSYSVLFDSNQMFTSRVSNRYGQFSIDTIDALSRNSGEWSWHYISIDTGTASSISIAANDASTMVIQIIFTYGRTYSSLGSTAQCSIEAGVIGSDPLNPITCQLIAASHKMVIYNVYSFTNDNLKIYYRAQMASSQANLDVYVRAFANVQAYNDYNWPIVASLTNTDFTFNSIFYSSYPSYSARTTSETTYSTAVPSTDSYSNYFNVLSSSGTNTDTSGYSKIITVTSTQIVVRVMRTGSWDTSTVYRMGFRFYSTRLTPSGCNSVSISSNRYGASYFYPSNGVWSKTCGTDTTNRMFFVVWYFYQNVNTLNQWPYWYGGDYYDMTFNFNSIGQDAVNYANMLSVTASIIYQTSRYYTSNEGQCGCCSSNCCTGTCYDTCSDIYSSWSCNPHCCNPICCTPCSCRWIYGWDYFTVTGDNNNYWTQPTNAIAAGASINLVSNQYSVQTQFSFYLQNLYTSFTSAMTSTTSGSNAQLIVTFTGNNVFPNSNPFEYTSDSEKAAPIECLCVVSGSGITITSSTSYTTANCTRHIVSGLPPTISVRIDASNGQYLACYFPGFIVPSNGNGGTMYANFYRDPMNFFKAQSIPQQYISTHQTKSVSHGLTTTSISSSFNGFSYNNLFWTTSGKTSQSKYYQLYVQSPSWLTNPILYLSSYSPKFTQSICNTASFIICRAYNSFYSRRYFLVAQTNGNAYYMTLSATLTFPQSREYSGAYYITYIGWTYNGFGYYYCQRTDTLDGSYLTASTPTIGYSPSIYGSNLNGYSTSMTISVNLNGYPFYSNQRSQTNNPFSGSFMLLTMSGFSTINGCGAFFYNEPTPTWANNALYCVIQNSNSLKIYTNADLTISGTMYITLNTDALPSSTSYIFELYDRYVSSTNYGRSVYTSGSFGRSASGYTLLQPNNIKWRRQTYKQLRYDNGPIRLTLNNNFQYVSNYDMTANAESSESDAILVKVPGSGLTSTSYYCLAREYLPTKYYLYTQFVIGCQYYSTTQILIRSVPSHILSPTYNYELIIYKNTGSGSSLIAMPPVSTATYIMQVGTINAYSSGTIQYYDYIPVNNYLQVYPITLNSIYILTREAAAFNSLYLSFTVGIASSTVFFFEFIFDSFDLNYFGIVNGGEIPCFLDTPFSTYGSKTKLPRCFGYADGVNTTTPLIIRVLNFAGYTAGTNFKLAFDNFNNPPLQALFMVPINVRINLRDRTNSKVYTSYFPQIYISDSFNTVIPTNIGGSLSRTSASRGIGNYHYLNLNWPYNSNSGDISQKIVMKLQGGITCCRAFSSLTLIDSQSAVYTLLWSNLRANTSVYITPTKGYTTNTNLTIQNVINPEAVMAATNDQLLTATFIFYSSYKTSYITRLNQFAFSSYSMNTDFSIYAAALTQSNANFDFHNGFPMTYDFHWNNIASSYSGRNLSYLIIYFTSGVSKIEAAWVRWGVSPYYFNPTAAATVGYSTSASQWYVNITGLSDSTYSVSYDWYLRVRLYVNSNYFYFTSYVYNYNGIQQFTHTSTNYYAYGAGYNSSSQLSTPTTWALMHQRYTNGYFELSRNFLYATAGQTTNKLFFKFTSPYNISQVQTFSFISSSTSFPAPVASSSGLYCIIQLTTLTKSTYGAGLYAPCSYSSGVYTVQAPVGGLTTTEYLLTVIDRKQLTTTFNMPTTPQRVQISLIYNSIVNLQYGDVYTLDFPGVMTSYTVDHAHYMSGEYDMLGFRFTPAFSVSAASTTSPVTQTVLSFEVESNYYDSCLGVSGVFSGDGVTFYNGMYYSHFSNIAVLNANTRVLCGQNTQNQNWAPAKLTVTDYGAMSAGTSYYFRFPLIDFPTGTTVPLTYKVKLLQYANGNSYPVIMNQYVFQNLNTVSPGNVYNSWASISLSSNDVQKTMSMSYTWSSWSIPNTCQTWVKYKNNMIPALTSITTLSSLSNTNFNYQYYPNINLCVFIKSTANTDYGFSLGTYPTSNDQQSFKLSWIYGFPDSSTKYQGYLDSGVNQVSRTINIASSWTTSSISLVSCLLTSNSWGTYTVAWSANYLTFPQGSYMVLTFTSEFTLVDQYCLSMSGFYQGTDIASNLVCKRLASDKILIDGYATLLPSASLSISLYLKITDNYNGTYTPYVNIVVYSSTGATIINANTNYYTLIIAQQGSSTLGLSGTMTRPYSAGTAFPLFVTFRLNTHSLTNGDYLQIDFGNWVLDPAATGIQVFKYQFSGSIYWVPAAATKVSGNIYKIPVYNNYSMNAGVTITIWVDTFSPDTYYGAMNNANRWNTFKIYAYHSAVLVEQAITRIWTEPFSHTSFTATPSHNYINAYSLYEFSVTPNVSISDGDTILIQFTTADGSKSNLFPINLGVTIPSGLSGNLDCNQIYNTHIISDTPIKCRVYAGDNSASPSIPATIAIPVKKNIPVNTAIKFNIIDILNPALNNYPIGINFKVANNCSSLDMNNLCTYYKSMYYMTFDTVPYVPGFGSAGSLSFNPTRVSANNTVHTVSAGYPLVSGDFVKLTYYTQIAIPAVCAISSNNGYCYSYPMTNSIIIKVNVSISSPYTFTLTGMNNPYQNYYGTNTFAVQIWHSGSVTAKFYSSYTAATITTDPTSSTPLGITFTPTLTPNYELKYTFWNIALVTINNILQNNKIQQIYITAPGEITLDTKYCNATMQTYPGEAIPYPYRFVCKSVSSNSVVLNLQSDFPAWTANFTQRKIYVYLKYSIANSQTVQSNNWYAYAYTDPSSTTSYYLVSQAQGNFPIVEYQSPFLYVINFPTRSFSQRTCTIGQKCMFYGFIYPTTPKGVVANNVASLTFLLPKEFNYSSLQSFDSCTIQSRTITRDVFNCPITRNNSQITIGYTIPVSYTYQQLYDLINLDHSNAPQLFISPNFPGDHYRMQVNLWNSAGQLLESQYINLTTVYGYYLAVPTIYFNIPLDASSKGLFDLQFTVGIADILPSYINSADNSVTSAIQITFANSFDADLGTGLPAGSQIACLNITGMTFSTMGRIKCRIYPSVSTITYPTIIVTGYDRIYAGSVVRILFANLKSIPAGVTDYCKLGVSLTYFNYGGAKGYIYEAVSVVVGPPTAVTVPVPISFSVNEVSTNYVGELSNYTFAVNITAGYTPVTTNDYIVVQFPPYIFQGRFNLNAQTLCSLATNSLCLVFGLAGQIYIKPAATVSATSFSFTINKTLNAAFEIEYINQTIKLFTVVSNKVNAVGTAVFLKFTQASMNASAIINTIDSIYGGDSGINYYFQFQLNSYLPENGKVSIFFPSIFISLFTVNSQCFFRYDSQALVGKQAYCQIISSSQIVIIPNGVLLTKNQPYYFTVTNITNPNVDLANYRFKIQTYYFIDVYRPSVISRNTFSSPILSLITVKQCQLQVNLSIYNSGLPAQYQINLICSAPIKQASQLKLYLSWNPSTTNGTCSGDSSILYSTQCNILTEYSQTTLLTYLSIYLRGISAQKLVSITGTIMNANQGTYSIKSSISFNGFVYMQSKSNQFYISSSSSAATSSSTATIAASSTSVVSGGQAISIKNNNYPLNRYYQSIYTFAITNPRVVVSTLQIEVPSLLTQSKSGLACGYQTYRSNDNYFNLMMKQGTNILSCSMTGQKISITGLTSVLSSLAKQDFLYLTIFGIINPATSVSQVNFTFTLINTTSSITQAVNLFTLPLSYAVSDAPLDLQISDIYLNNNKYYVMSNYTFTLTSVNSAALTIVRATNLGLIIHFPPEYTPIWSQIPTPVALSITINTIVYTSNNITLSPGYLFATFAPSTFTSQLSFTTFKVDFIFRNPNSSIDCSAIPVFVISLFDFKGNSIFGQTLSNNKVCPTLNNRLYTINITGNTKISAGSSSVFVVSIEQPAKYLSITPFCATSAISFSPSTIVFQNFSSKTQNFTISAATGLSGSFNITFSKNESAYTFYNDIQFTTINIYTPVAQYSIKIIPFSVKSIGNAIVASISLEVPNPSEFALLFTNDCNNDFIFNPANRIAVPPKATEASFSIKYKGSVIPPACQLNFTISSLTTNSYILVTPTVYLSASISIDKSSTTPPLLLQLTTSYKNSTSVGYTVVSTATTNNAAVKSSYTPSIYTLNTTTIASNKAIFESTTSQPGIIYYAVISSGTPERSVTQQLIYNNTLSSAISYGKSTASLNTVGVNIAATFTISGLAAQTSYLMAAYLNSTVGISSIIFKNFSTGKSSNGAAIKLAMSSMVNNTAFLVAFSNVLRIQSSRISVLTVTSTLANLQTTYQSSVMNNRSYIYDVVIAPDRNDDSVRPIDLLNNFIASTSAKAMLKQFQPQYILSYLSSTRQIVVAKPKIRKNISISELSHDHLALKVSFWQQNYVYAVIIPAPTNRTLSSQIIAGLDATNNPIVSQHYQFAQTDQNGNAEIRFTLLSDNTSYTIFVTAECILPFNPRLSLSDDEVLTKNITTQINLNLMKNKDQAFNVINKVDPELAKAVKQHITNTQMKNSILGVDKTKKIRKHD